MQVIKWCEEMARKAKKVNNSWKLIKKKVKSLVLGKNIQIKWIDHPTNDQKSFESYKKINLKPERKEGIKQTHFHNCHY